ncbi:hypothetical protein ACLOJK_009671 [Asimina triloba]
MQLALGPRAPVALVHLWGYSRPFCSRSGRRCYIDGLNEQSVLLDQPPLSFLSRNVTGNHFIEFTNGAGRAKVELPCELMVPYALDEGRHIHLSEEAWDLLSLLVESGHVVSQWFVRLRADANELSGGDRSLPLVTKLDFKQINELSEVGYGDGGERQKPHFFLLV